MDAYWAAVDALRASDLADVWALVAPLATSDDPRLRALVPDALRYLGGPRMPMLEATVELLAHMLASPQADEVLGSIAAAFVDLRHPASVALLRPFVTHPSSDVRSSVVHGLLSEAGRAVPELIALSRDADANVRDWATFGLSLHPTWREAEYEDSPERREALWDRHDDVDDDARGEALIGLAGMRDPRVWVVIERELTREADRTHCVEAAEILGDSRLLPALFARRDRGDDSEELEAAIAACSSG